MKQNNIYIAVVFMTILLIVGCKNKPADDGHNHGSNESHTETETSPVNDSANAHGEDDGHNHGTTTNDQASATEDEHGEEIVLAQDQLDILNIKVDVIPERNMSGFIQVNGQLGVPPQNEAIVTTTLGANIQDIRVLEGDKVRKGQVLAYISHPDIISMQTEFLQNYNRLTFLEQDYNRQKKLYDANVGSGRDFQRAQSAYLSAKGLTKGYESQLRLLGLVPNSIKQGNIAEVAPVRSPISGFIETVQIKSGQYVEPQTALFEVVNTEHIHVDLMVFEKDISKVKNKQLVKFKVEALGGQEMTAKIYAVGKSFEEGPKALHVHAEIENKDKNLIPGMYVTARILTDENFEMTLPEDGVFQEGEAYFIFTAEKEDDGTWGFAPVEVIVSSKDEGFTAFKFKEEVEKGVLVAQSGAYYLMAEMKKSEAEHSH